MRKKIYPEPSKNYTHWGGFPITKYAIYRYSQSLINNILDSIVTCEHGDTCSICCFSYVKKNDFSARRLCSRAEVLMPLTTFLYELAFGKFLGLRRSAKCKNTKCCNIHHVAVYNCESHYSVMEKIWKCEHGETCKDCCWPWLGSVHMSIYGTSKPHIHIRGKKQSVIELRKFLVEEIFNIRDHGDMRYRTICDDLLCGNWHHIYKTKHVNGRLQIADRHQTFSSKN